MSGEAQGVPETGPRLSNMSIVSPPVTPRGTETPIPVIPGAASNTVTSELADLPKVFCESRARIPTTTGSEIFLHVYSNNVDKKEHLAIVVGEHIHSKTLFAKREGETEMDRMTRGAYDGVLFPGRTSSHSGGVVTQTPVSSSLDGQTATGEGSSQTATAIGSGAPAATSNSAPKSASSDSVLVRIHSECYTGETAWSARCDCGEQLDEAARIMSNEGLGVIVYLRQEGRGIGLGEKLKAYNLQDLGADTVMANLMLRHPADARSFGMATAILVDLGLHDIRLLTNNPDKIAAVEGKNGEIKVTERVPMVPLSWQKKGGFQSQEVNKYLETKVSKMGHLLNLP